MSHILNLITENEKIFWWFFIITGLFLFLISFLVYPHIIQNYNQDIGKTESIIFLYGLILLGISSLIAGVSELSKLSVSVRVIERYIVEPKNLSQWSTAVRTRDGYKCAYCDETDCLDAHHLAPKSIYPGLRLNVNNGVTVCKSHHYIAADIFRRLQEVLTMGIRCFHAR